MPIFSKKYDIKTIPARAKRQNINYPLIHEEPNDLNNISLTLNKNTYKLIDGQWISSNHQNGSMTGANDEDVTAIKKRLRRVEEEHNLQQLKIDILLDMLTENLNELNVLKNSQ